MATYINNIFNFGRSLPSPFDTIANKKIKVSSKYGDGTTSTLCGTVIKAVHAVCHCMDGSGEGAVGIIDHRTAAEYKSSAGADAYHLVVYDSNTGSLMASVYDSNMETFENYTLNSSGRDGAAVMMALFPMLMQDDEFKESFEAYQDELNAGYPHMDKATEYMALMCDNAYRRIKDDSCVAHIKVNVDKAGNLMRVSQTHLDSGSFTPTTVLAGEFKIFAQTGPAQIYSATETIDHADFEGQYVLNKRTFTPQETMLIPKLPEWYIIPKEVVDICKHAKATTGKSMQMRNFLLRGPAGTGKTMGAKAIAAGLGLPYMKYTCSANTEIFDFVGMIFPDSEDSTGSAQLDAERETLMKMGGINYANVSKLMKLPDLDDIRKQMDLFLDTQKTLLGLIALEKEKAKHSVPANRVKELQDKLDQKKKLFSRLYIDFKDGILTQQEYLLARDVYQKEIAAYESELQELQAIKTKTKVTETGARKWNRLISRYYKTKTVTEEMVEAMVDEIRVNTDGSLDIRFKYMPEFEEMFKECERIRKEVA